MALNTDCLGKVIACLAAECLGDFGLVCKDWRAAVEAAPITAELGGTSWGFTTLLLKTVKFCGHVSTFVRSDGIRSFTIRIDVHTLEFYNGAVGVGWKNSPRKIAGVYFGKAVSSQLEIFRHAGIPAIMISGILAACMSALAAN